MSSEKKRKSTVIIISLFLLGGLAGIYFYLDWLWRACGGVEGC